MWIPTMLFHQILFNFIYLITNHQILVAYNCGSHTNISTKYVKYTSDQMYQGLTSRMALKPSLPSSIIDQEDKKLLISQRVTDYDSFSYFFKITARDHYLLIFKFIEVVSRQKDQRVFNIKIGDEIVHKVDIFADVGYGNLLHKWIGFDLKQDIIYLNKTYPALNAYIYTKRLLKVTFEKIKGTPKIDAIILIKGQDSQSIFIINKEFLNDYLSYEQSKNIIVRQYISQKYHILPQRKFKQITKENRQDFIQPEQGFFIKILKKYLLKIFISTIGVLFLIFHQKIYLKLNLLAAQNREKLENIHLNINITLNPNNIGQNKKNKGQNTSNLNIQQQQNNGQINSNKEKNKKNKND